MRLLTKLLRFIFIPEGDRARAAYLLLVIMIAAFFAFALDFPNYVPQFWKVDFKLGLDLKGGAHLVYVADLASVEKKEQAQAMSGLRDTIERRVNSFGIAEPNVQTSQVGDEHRLIVELAGVTDVNRAIAMIGETPFLEFKEERAPEETQAILEAQKQNERTMEDPYFIPTGLTGKYLERSELTFDPNSYNPVVNLNFDADGTKLFKDITTRNVDRRVAIYLDGLPISVPVVNEPITAGQAVVSGNFSVEEARALVQRLNSGALPVPIALISQQSMEASLGQVALERSLKAGIYAIIAVGVFMIVWYRIPGILAVIALLIYTLFSLAVFKLFSVTLTLAGIVGFILSIGMAVDANILIFARMREEVRSGKRFALAVHDGFTRAWPSIRDSNISTLITCFVLYFFTASLVKGFALTLAIGVLVSMFSAISVTRLLLRVSISEKFSKFKFLWYQ
ncbi:MAG: protein translocase subunit SecD [Candidatus Azambacteria bacterium]|nr:protein translocase subunit SecD [Candidatus Azambacteria bacterium]